LLLLNEFWGSAKSRLPKRRVRLVTQQDTKFENEGPVRRFHVELFIVHPTMAPAEISTVLNLEAHSAKRAGDSRKTPKGKPLAGNYSDTRWRHCVECSTTDQWFAAEVTTFLDRLDLTKRSFQASGPSVARQASSFNFSETDISRMRYRMPRLRSWSNLGSGSALNVS
jgi:hypothetical protein